MLIWGVAIKLMRKDVYTSLKKIGVTNIDTYEAIIENPYTGKDMTNYLAFNVVGRVKDIADPEKMTLHPLLFSTREKGSKTILHQLVKNQLEQHFPSLEFIEVYAF